MNYKRILIENQINIKNQLNFQKYIDGCLKLDYFFTKFVEYRECYRRYPSINKWREFVVISLLENLSKNKKLKFDMAGINSNKKLKENICSYQKNKILLYDFCFSCALDFYDKNNITINSLSMEICYEMIIDKIKDDFNGLHLAREIETNIFSRLSKIDNSNRFENSIGHNSILNELETELYKTIENLENPEYNNLFSLDKVLLQLSYKISSKNIIYNLNYLKTILSNERCFSYQRLNSNNIIAKKYIEISKMLLSILNPKEKKLINLRYGLDADRRHTLFDIYEMNKYKNYKELFEELTRALWKLKICWPNQILYKLLFCCEEEYEEESIF